MYLIEYDIKISKFWGLQYLKCSEFTLKYTNVFIFYDEVITKFFNGFHYSEQVTDFNWLEIAIPWYT